MKPELIATAQMFLVPMSIFFTALGVAKTEQLKTAISVLGFAISLVWLLRFFAGTDLSPPDHNTALALGWIFTVAWGACAIVHAWWWIDEGSFWGKA